MAHGIDSSVGGLSANSYVSMASALDYSDHNSFTSTWSTYTSALRENALITATEYLDVWVEWNGDIVSEHRIEQNLRWPRYGVYDLDGYEMDSDIVPVWLKNATTEFAFNIISSGDPFAVPDTAGFKKLKVGSLELEVAADDRDQYGGIPDRVQAIVEPYGVVRNKGGDTTATLVRT